MNAGRAFAAPPPDRRERSLETSLFGGAVLATVATASLGQTFFSDVSAINAGVVSTPYVVLGGYYKSGDGGGGTLLLGPSGCTADGGLVFKDSASNCLYRVDPSYDVRQWGARCDVVEVNSTVGRRPGPPARPGTLSAPTTMLSRTPQAGQFIAISQIGGPTLWANTTAAPHGAVSMTRNSVLGASHRPATRSATSFRSRARATRDRSRNRPRSSSTR